MAARFVKDYGLPEYDAATLTQSKAMAAYFEAAAKASGQPKLASNWIMGELSRRINAENLPIERVPVDPQTLASLIGRIADGTISNNAARQVFDQLWTLPPVTGTMNATEAGQDTFKAVGHLGSVDAIIDAKGLRQMNDTGALEKIID